MSKTAKITFYGSVAATIAIVSYIHYDQKASKNRLLDGVARDMERQEQRRFENMFVLEQQLELAKQLQAKENLIAEES